MKKLLLILLLVIPILAMGQGVKKQRAVTLPGKEKKTEQGTTTKTNKSKTNTNNNGKGTGRPGSNSSGYADTYINVDGDTSTDAFFTQDAGSRDFSIRTNAGSWSVSSSPAWVIIGNKTRQGLTLRVGSNTESQPRTGQVVLKTPKGHKATINVTQATTAVAGQPTVTMKKVKQLHNQSLSDGQGMKILLTFDIQNFKGKDARAVAYFYDADDNQLIDTDNETGYGTKGSVSHVAASKMFKPSYDNSTYTDLEISIPYAQLHQTGTTSRTLKFEIYVWDESTDDGDAFYNPGTFYSFSFTPGANNTTSYYLLVDGKTDSPQSIRYESSGGYATYEVSTNASDYETWGVPSWCSVTNKTSTGFRLVCEPNTLGTERSDYMKVKAGGQEIRINIKQDANPEGASATIDRVWLEENVTQNGQKGLKVHAYCEIENMKDQVADFQIWFYQSDNISKVYDTAGDHLTYNEEHTVSYESSVWKDFQFFVPYSDFSANTPNGTLTVDFVIRNSSGQTLVRNDNHSFTFNSSYRGSTSSSGSYLLVDGKTDSPQSIKYKASGGYATYEVSTNASDYETWGVPSWCSVTNKTSTSFKLVCQPNPLGTERSDYMKVKAGGKEIRINIKQEANTDGPSATIERVWLEENVTQNGQRGLKVHAHCNIDNMKDQVADFQIWFYQSDNISKVNNTSGSHLTYSEEHTVSYESSTWKDFQFFVPYSDFGADTPSGTLTVDFVIRNSSGETLVRNDNHSFTFNSSYRGGSGSTPTVGNGTATIKRVWMEYGVYQNGQKGMKVHAHCTADNMKGKKLDFQVWYYYSDDITPVNNTSGEHLWRSLEDTAPYDQTEWKDITFFIPYSDINVPSGFHDDLAVDFVIRDENFDVLDRKDNNAFNFRK